jgi:uncharacterized membrane protein YsdA (DUF1294 family)
MFWQEIILIYFLVISLFSILFTVYDKRASVKKPDRRVPEAKLILLSLLGGSLAMYITMQSIRHKTRHIKFMLGIPLIMILQIAAVYLVFCLSN